MIVAKATGHRRRAGARAVAGVLSIVLGALAVGVPPATAAPAQRPPRGSDVFPAPQQIRALDFMLGRHVCRLPGDPTGPVRVTMDVRKQIDGHFYYAELRQFLYSATLPDPHAMGIYGWDPVAGKLILQYHDNWGSHGSGTSPGWQDGHLRFTGQLSQVAAPTSTGVTTGFPIQLADDWQVIGPGHFTLSQTATLPNGSSVTASFDCVQRR
ncbi:hypothetical protein [Phytohabitans houttuyneae]|uniref:Uncharacterized protein n=1 Tax=Phytohabitans houttuyneae TaxID=1076126 RepID=A0A6V8KFF9_9ACTN|nr:hypothetical protein [Phytohabitans houttuyneae]GFJ80776.1 hypothetical protein Phou_049560 [Phytohabitans houttuyneae]